MGMYLNPGNSAFRISVNDDIYVDKSGLIAFVNHRIDKRKRYICVSRPRRFGKSMAAEMLSAYYDKSCDSHDLFEHLEIAGDESYRIHLNQYDVIFLNIQQILSGAGSGEHMLAYLQAEVLAELREVYRDWIPDQVRHLPTALAAIYAKNTKPNKGFIFILDEWDCIFRESKEDVGLQKAYLDFLRDLFKDRTYVKVAYMTGILPIKKYGTHSALNIFDEISMTNADSLAKYAGFTESEVRNLCDTFHKDFEEIRRWYDGYCLGENHHIYNPKSVVDSMQSRALRSFWTNTETYEALQFYIDIDQDGLKESIITMLSGGKCKVDAWAFQNDMTSFKSKDDILTLLVHLGYLAYEEDSNSVYIPNREVREEFVRALKNGRRSELVRLLQTSEKLVAATWQKDSKEVARLMEVVHSSATSPDFYNNEQALRSVIRFAYLSCVDEYITIQEMPSGIGYADVVFLPRKSSDKPAMVIELKWNKSATGAINQIKEKKYTEIIEHYGGKLLLVGINYDSINKQHECVIEEWLR